MLTRCSCIRDSQLDITITDSQCPYHLKEKQMTRSDPQRESLIEMLVMTLEDEYGAGSDLPGTDYEEDDERLWLQGYQGSLDVGHLADDILNWIKDYSA